MRLLGSNDNDECSSAADDTKDDLESEGVKPDGGGAELSDADDDLEPLAI